MKERRRESRLWCSDLVKVEWRDNRHEAHISEAVLEDIAAHSACVQVEEPIPVGVEISVSAGCTAGDCAMACQTHGVQFFGHVSRCEYQEYGYFVGVRFSDQTTWSSGVFQPQHLTNLEDLATD